MAAKAKREQAVKAVAAIRAHYESGQEDWRRGHLGASVIGHACDRKLWLSFRWAAKPAFDGRMLRLLERGQREEAWVVDDLRSIGCEVVDVDPKTGDQTRVKWGHVGGGVDGIVRGLPDCGNNVEVLLEVKTTNLKGYERLADKGVKSAKPEHYVQMQTYMFGLSLDEALYVAVCKDNDEWYTEMVPFDEQFAQEKVDRAVVITLMGEPPERQVDSEYPPCVLTSKDGTRWPCQYYEVCHGKQMPEGSCRTCIEARPDPSGDWICNLHGNIINEDEQRAGCGDHVTLPAMVNAQVVSACEEQRQIVYAFADGSTVTDGAANG
jgi:hypothetical protein